MDTRRTNTFSSWLHDLRDARAKAKIAARIQRLALGNPGDVESVGNGISELRIHYGPGYRVYYLQMGDVAIILCGGDKSTQSHDIERAKRLAEEAKVLWTSKSSTRPNT